MCQYVAHSSQTDEWRRGRPLEQQTAVRRMWVARKKRADAVCQVVASADTMHIVL
jgi:hypothetical protein